MMLQDIIDLPAVVGFHIELAVTEWVIFFWKNGTHVCPVGSANAPHQRLSDPQSRTSKFANPLLFSSDQRQETRSVNLGSIQSNGVKDCRHQIQGLGQGGG